MKTFTYLFFIFCLSTPVWALRPIAHYHDLIAGEPEPGYRDGSFESAQFNGPQGIALDETGDRLFVADKNNNCIRVILQDQKDAVATLAGFLTPGNSNGSLRSASFNKPTLLVYLGDNRLVVYDSGNSLLRLVDLTQGTVQTLAGTGKAGDVDGKALEASLGNIFSMVYFPSENSIYFSEPSTGQLRKLDLTAGQISTIPWKGPQLTAPGALCIYKNQLCAVDSNNNSIVQVDAKGALQILGNFDTPEEPLYRVRAIAASGESLYGFRQGTGASLAKFPNNSRQKFFTPWGKEIIWDKYPSAFPAHAALGFIADPREEHKFYLTAENLPCVLSVKDYNFESGQNIGGYNSSGMSDFEYPAQKPPKTFRILVIGNSMSYSLPFQDEREGGWNRSVTFPKQLELLLNTRAAFEDVPLNYEVLSVGHPEYAKPTYLWPYYEVPKLVKKYDIDLVLFIMPTLQTTAYELYFQRPITSEGIPAENDDAEYLLKPWKEKIPVGTPEDLYEKCLAHNWVKPASKSALQFESTQITLTDPDVRKDIIELLSKPTRMLSKKLKEMKTSAGNPVKYQMFLIYRDETNGSLERYRDFWKDMAQADNFPLLDMVGDFLAFKPTYEGMYSYEDFHYRICGMGLYTYLVSQELIRHHLIPFSKPGTKK